MLPYFKIVARDKPPFYGYAYKYLVSGACKDRYLIYEPDDTCYLGYTKQELEQHFIDELPIMVAISIPVGVDKDTGEHHLIKEGYICRSTQRIDIQGITIYDRDIVEIFPNKYAYPVYGVVFMNRYTLTYQIMIPETNKAYNLLDCDCQVVGNLGSTEDILKYFKFKSEYPYADMEGQFSEISNQVSSIIDPWLASKGISRMIYPRSDPPIAGITYKNSETGQTCLYAVPVNDEIFMYTYRNNIACLDGQYDTIYDLLQGGFDNVRPDPLFKLHDVSSLHSLAFIIRTYSEHTFKRESNSNDVDSDSDSDSNSDSEIDNDFRFTLLDKTILVYEGDTLTLKSDPNIKGIVTYVPELASYKVRTSIGDLPVYGSTTEEFSQKYCDIKGSNLKVLLRNSNFKEPSLLWEVDTNQILKSPLDITY